MRRTAAESEDTRQLVHIAFGTCALLLRWLTWFQATMLASVAVAFNLFALHRLGGANLFRADERGRYRVKSGIVLYPSVVVGLLLLLPERPDIVAGAWGVLAAGDGAATLIGRRMAIRPIPWNPNKSVGGSLAFICCGSAAAAFLLWWCRGAIVPPSYWWFPLAAGLLGAVAAALVETIPIALDDNVSVTFTAAAVMWLVSLVSADQIAAAIPRAGAMLIVALGINAAVATAGYLARTVSVSGAGAGAVLGTIIYVAAGWQGWLLLLATFAIATIASRLGLDRKRSLNIEQEREGRRGAANAFANTGVAAIAALLSILSYGGEWALIGVVAALAAGGSDTVASEIGKAFGRRTFLVTTLARVPPGTPGAISLEGTLAGAIAAVFLAGLGATLNLIPWNAVVAVFTGAIAGSLLESLLGASLEPDGVLNNDVLNFLNTAAAAYVAIRLWGFM